MDTCTGAPFFGAGGDLNQAIYSQRDATFRGGEFQAQLDVAPLWGGTFGVDGQYDIVRATFTDGTNVPRIPPQRLGGGVFWRDGELVRARRAAARIRAERHCAVAETPTDGYNLLKAELTYTKRLRPTDFGWREVTVGMVGNNLLDDDIRNHVSFKKDEVLMPGRGVRVFATLKN